MKRFVLMFLFLPLFSFAQTTLNDASIEAGQTVTLSGEYVMDGFVYVEEGATLIIQPGTVIKAMTVPTTGDNTSALIIARGAKIMAEGTADNPIIFTAEGDDLAVSNDLTWADRGLWGGLIVLGHATTNRGIEGQIEGIPTTETRTVYGGNDDHDNSGVIRYVSIRHGGAELAPGDEINGLTFGAVGDGTTVEYVEIFANLDDGVEWFGGTVGVKNVVAAFCGDDAFDYDEGWRGKNQFLLALQGPDAAGRIAEQDGGTVDETGTPYAQPYFYNATYIGAGVNNFPQGDGQAALYWRDNAGGHYANSIITDYNGANGGGGIVVEDLDGESSRDRMDAGQLTLKNNIWYGFADGNELSEFAAQDFVQAHLAANNNQIVDPQLNGISRDADGMFDPRPAPTSPAASGAMAPAMDMFEAVPYIGAFDPNAPLWINGWTALAAEGHLAALPNNLLNDAAINAGETLVLEAGEYILDGLVYVEAGASLILKPGVVIKATAVPTNGDNTSALIITRDAKIYADGTADAPIIFTAEADDLGNPSDLTWADRGLWGGLIILGNATTNRGIEGQIEGIPTTETRTVYGGDNDHDDSGILRYVSIRHGGAELAPGDEINGLTLGAVGDQTIIDHVEIFANLDDGVEWFGGTVGTTHLVAAFCGDDAFDFDEGWRGKNQFWFAIQGPDAAGRIAEQDGGTVDETAAPYSQPHIYNATYIGAGVNNFPQGDGQAALYFRDNAGGHYANSIITDFNGSNGGGGIVVEDLDGTSSRDRLEAGQLTLTNNVWYGFADGNSLAEFAPQDFVQAHLAANNNDVADPMLNGVSRDNDGMLDPRPSAGSIAASGAVAPVLASFQKVDYRGAFAPNKALWLNGWTALYAEGHLAYTADAATTSGRNINHVTRINGEFVTDILATNTSNMEATVTLHPYAADGSAFATADITVPANGTWSSASTTVFGADNDVSHFMVSGSAHVSIAAGYRVAAGEGATAMVQESGVLGNRFMVIPGEQAIVFDGVAVVNHGSGMATVSLNYVDANGMSLGMTTVSDSVAVGGKALAAFAPPAGTAAVWVESSQPAGVVFLRGTQAGVSGPQFLFEVAPMVVD